jgi:glycosidase
LNNNDTGPRFVTQHGIGLTRAATVALLTLPGIPCLYSFDEEGGELEPYAGLAPKRIVPHPELLDLHRRLIALRHEQSALRGAEVRFLATPGNASAYWRPGTPPLLVAINWSSGTLALELELPSELSGPFSPLSGEPAVAQSGRLLRLGLPAYGYAVLVAGRQ